ncbi:hypothetical protein [Aequorivita capsosiphonis]|uniref:hypothetical protein n=1 Tax=Aequorivita capsosiphonis TaxID=487317 RepID=UPI0012F866E7|nr:hypothetical protein [Aequorivita capsosiphonis]
MVDLYLNPKGSLGNLIPTSLPFQKTPNSQSTRGTFSIEVCIDENILDATSFLAFSSR